MRSLVIGANGLLGSNVVYVAIDRDWYAAGTYHTKKPAFETDLSRLDIRNDDDFGDIVQRTKPDVVINCAAITDVDACEQHPEEARAINAQAPGELAEECASRGISFVHISTDYVFDGTDAEPYAETDSPSPLQEYGQTKLEGEHNVVRQLDTALIVRVSFLYGLHGANGSLRGFPAWVRSRIFNGDTVPAFTDQRTTPTRAGQAADTILDLVTADASGVFHIASRSCISPYQFAMAVANRLDASGSLVETSVRSDLDRPADRPSNTCLAVEKVETELDRPQPQLARDLDATLDPT